MSVSIRSQPHDSRAAADSPLIMRLLKTIDRLDPEKLGALWDAQSRTDATVEQSVMLAGLADDREIAEAYAKHYLLPLFDLPQDQPLPIDLAVARLVPAGLCRGHLIAPLADDGHTLDVAIVAPEALRLADTLKRLNGRQMRAFFAPRSVIQRLLNALYAADPAMDQTDAGFSESREPGAASELDAAYREASDSAAEDPVFEEIDAPVAMPDDSRQAMPAMRFAASPPVDGVIVECVNAIFEQALRAGASVIHLDQCGDRCRLRLRAGGRLSEVDSPPVALLPAIVARIKTLARLDAGDCGSPQDGVLRLSGSSGRFDVGVSTCPTTLGEKVVMRLRQQIAGLHDLRRLGLDDQQRRQLNDALRSSHAMVLFTGPSGSGKRSSLYSCINDLHNEHTNLCTVEDPVECRLPGVHQLQVRPAVGLTFPNALRTVLRQDPDGVMVSELRDAETAALALDAACRGCLVLSSLATADAPATISRLQQWGCEPCSFGGALRLLVAQRLVRRLCPVCRDAYPLDAAAAKRHGLPAGVTLYRPGNCDHCQQTGYLGHLAVFEVVPLTGPVEHWLQRGASPEGWPQTAGEAGIRRLRQSIRDRVLEGATSLDEALRVAAPGRRNIALSPSPGAALHNQRSLSTIGGAGR